jgi:hypothetical protein
MPLTDSFGRAWAHRDSIKVGDVLECDDGFTCIRPGDHKIVKAFEGELKHHDPEYAKDPFARLYIECSDGTHSLDGQVGEDGELVGLYPV